MSSDSLFLSDVMGKKIVEMALMNLKPVLPVNVAVGHSNVKMDSALLRLLFVMELMIAVMDQMNKSVTYLVLNWNSSVNPMDDVFWIGMYNIKDIFI